MARETGGETMADKLVTIFGGSGFIGRYLVRHLATQGWRVRLAVRDAELAKSLKTAGNVGQISMFPCSVTDPASVAAAVHGADVVVNLVGVLYARGKRSFQAIHVDGAANVAKAATAAGVKRLVHISALGADEHSPSLYAQSKAAGELAVRAAFPNATILRPSVVFGTEDGFFNLFGWIAQVFPVLPFFTNANPLTPAGGGPKFQPVYVGDVVEAMTQALTGEGHAGKTYELVGPRVYDMREIMHIVNRETQRKRWIIGVPFFLAQIKSYFLQFLPTPLLTPDQVRQLKLGSVGTGRRPGLAVFGITPTTVEVVVPTYLKRYRPLQQTKKLRLARR
jgi:NADH dehydrogenase